ncbi:uncharacterized protein A1O5_03695 [Cladophialophora psammophila CBS 110553]|uniref:Uncharacterized protein n=1 Tax=Cladophialophora psammophila CBS 110553 TaxID=1182543 RepID=W9XQE1_9EURO|nr:uncharacterized protein A1O5_03695 [Cladophialophora psammophila CBS 110553]EXJ72549.1 hypothetical protein A1O5_03695 [Cladophialophora psammophila CBS 110553]
MAIKRRQTTKLEPITPELILQYPKQSFPLEISSLTDKLPDGFRELAVSCKISIQTIKLLHQVALRVTGERLEALPHVWGRSEQFELMRVVATASVPKLERQVCLLVLIFERSWLATTPDSVAPRRMYGRVGQVFRDRLREVTQNMAELGTDVDSDFMIWATMVIVTATDESKLGEEERKELMALLFMLCPQMKSWDTAMGSLRKYYWSQALMTQWHSEWLAARSCNI